MIVELTIHMSDAEVGYWKRVVLGDPHASETDVEVAVSKFLQECYESEFEVSAFGYGEAD
jgi:hypothetical protein